MPYSSSSNLNCSHQTTSNRQSVQQQAITMQVSLDRPDSSIRLHHSSVNSSPISVRRQRQQLSNNIDHHYHSSIGMNGRRSSTSSNESHQTSSSSCSIPDHGSSAMNAQTDGHFAIHDRNNNIKGLAKPTPAVRRQQPQQQPITRSRRPSIDGDKSVTPLSRIPTTTANNNRSKVPVVNGRFTPAHKTKSTSICSLVSGSTSASRIPTPSSSSSLSVDHRKFLTNYSSHNIYLACSGTPTTTSVNGSSRSKCTAQAKIQSRHQQQQQTPTRYGGGHKLNKSTIDLSASRSLNQMHDSSSSHSFGHLTKVPNNHQTPASNRSNQYRRNGSQTMMTGSLPRTRSTATIAATTMTTASNSKKRSTDSMAVTTNHHAQQSATKVNGNVHSSGKKRIQQHGGSVTSLNSAGSTECGTSTTGSSTGSLNEQQSKTQANVVSSSSSSASAQPQRPSTNYIDVTLPSTTTCSSPGSSSLVQVCSWIERNS